MVFKRKKLRHFRSIRALKFESAQRLRARSSYENNAYHIPANRISETALSFAVRVKLSTLVCIFLCKIVAGIEHASYD